MNKIKIVLSALYVFSAAVFAGDNAIRYPHEFTYEGNPLVGLHAPADPDVHVWDGEVWMYCSQDMKPR